MLGLGSCYGRIPMPGAVSVEICGQDQDCPIEMGQIVRPFHSAFQPSPIV